MTDNQFVKKGDVLVEIDPVDYNVRVDEAGAGLSAEKSRLAEMGTGAVAARSQLDELMQQAEGARINLEVQKKNLTQTEMEIKKAAGRPGRAEDQAAPGGTGHKKGRRSLQRKRLSPVRNTKMSRPRETWRSPR